METPLWLIVSATRYASVLDLGFGDSGKGLFVDALTRRWHAHSVVRFCGGAQAGHNVVTASQHHTFSQFGAGTFVSGTRTVLLHPFVLHPTALLVEAEALAGCGVHDALSRLHIDARCRITTPFHQAAGRLRELLRGDAAHGTCGVGVGETVRHSLAHPEQTLRYGDLFLPEAVVLEKLHAQRETLLAELHTGSGEERLVLQDESLALRWLRVARALARQSPPATIESLAQQLQQPGAVIFEGAQGILLDEWRGFHPHTTWSSTTPAALENALASLGFAVPVEHFGVLRTYLTRHGAGPLPTHDANLDASLPELHNQAEGWQGHFRCGHPDAVLLHYALECAPNLSGLFISHLDVFERGASLKWCAGYQGTQNLPLGNFGDLEHQSSLTGLLAEAAPNYLETPITSETAFFDHLASVTRLPVLLRSFGNTAKQVSRARDGLL